MTAFEQAWTFLKANPAMHDRVASVQPAAMNYGYAAMMAEMLDEQKNRGRFPSSYTGEGKSQLRPRLDVGERAADNMTSLARLEGKRQTRSDMERAYGPDGVRPKIQRTPRDEVEHPNKDEQNMMHTGEQQ